MTKICSLCRIEQPVDDFYGRHAACKTCHKKRVKAYSLKHPPSRERQRAWAKTYYYRNKEMMLKKNAEWSRKNPKKRAAINARRIKNSRERFFRGMGGCCARCGFSDFRALQIDHVNGNGKQDILRGRRASGFKLYQAIRRGDRRREDYQLLCANCNWIKRWEHNEHTRRPSVPNVS